VAPLQPQDSGAIEEPPAPPESADAPGEVPPPGQTEAESQAQAAGGRSRRRRRKKKPGPAAKPRPLIPAYTETEGPRAPSAVVVSPGAPTGEAAELLEPEPPSAPVSPPEAPPPPPKHPAKGAVILSVGLPGSGKTTWFKRKGVTPLSSDLVRTLLFDDPTEQRHQDLVFSSLRSLLRARLLAHMPMNYVDATNLSPKERRHWIRMAHEFGYEVQAVFFDVPLETCLERNHKRQRIVPEDVMQRMAAKLRPPGFEEGFSKIVIVRVKQRPEAEAESTGGVPGS
jgi:predicted kinase